MGVISKAERSPGAIARGTSAVIRSTQSCIPSINTNAGRIPSTAIPREAHLSISIICALRWRLIAAACVSAVVLSLVVSLLLPKRYTATASIVIEPPAGNDVRTATAVSPVYLESLRTYERFADQRHAVCGRGGAFSSGVRTGSIESLKQQVLKVTKTSRHENSGNQRDARRSPQWRSNS